MQAHPISGQTVKISEEGFTVDSRVWTPAIAEAIVGREGIAPLNETQWSVIVSLREEAARSGRTPDLQRLPTLSGVELPELRGLFPGDSGSLARSIAGLPSPPVPQSLRFSERTQS